LIIRSIDFETTGIPTPDDPQAIVEAGWCDIPATGYNSRLYSPGRPIPFEAMAVHHITEAMVLGRPEFDPSEIDGADIYVAHNADFERQFYKTDKPWICTWKVALRVFSDLPQHNLQFLRYALDLEFSADEPHRAGPDAMLAALLFERIQCEHDAPDIDTMIRWSNGHALYPRCPLHKHKGKPWSEVPSDYLEWIANKPNDVAADIKANARLELKKRAS
jgi:exodeoxyribonuclease X